jgi:hypothetical protein
MQRCRIRHGAAMSCRDDRFGACSCGDVTSEQKVEYRRAGRRWSRTKRAARNGERSPMAAVVASGAQPMIPPTRTRRVRFTSAYLDGAGVARRAGAHRRSLGADVGMHAAENLANAGARRRRRECSRTCCRYFDAEAAAMIAGSTREYSCRDRCARRPAAPAAASPFSGVAPCDLVVGVGVAR